jgi:cytochrome c-type biogenesis protein CcmF
MTITDIIGLTGAFFLCACLILLSLLLHLRPAGRLQGLLVKLAHIQSGLLALAVLALGALLQMGAFEFELVFNAVENAMSPLERLGGLWSGQESSLLFFAFVLSAAISLSITMADRIGKPAYIKTILLTLETTLLFFLVPNILASNPFIKIWMLPSGVIQTAVFPPDEASALVVSTDGQGMNPSLRHLAMLLHPPTLYLGLIGVFIPYAFLLAALLNKDEPTNWIGPLYPVVLAAWIFLTIGMFLGSWWAYTILGWGGYWGWDAVEISGLIPWLLSFGLIHSMRMQLQGLRYRGWIKVFIISIVLLTLLGILITRSGILESVHAYTSGTMGPMLTLLISIHLIAALSLLIFRQGNHVPKKEPRNSSDRLISWFNACLVGLVLIYLFGQTLPLTSQLFSGQPASFSAQDYEHISAPLLLLTLILAAFCPLGKQMDTQPEKARRALLWMALISLPVPLALLFFFPLSLAAAAGFWAASFLLVSWLRALWLENLKPLLNKKEKIRYARLGVNILHLGMAILALGILGVETLSSTYEGQLATGDTISAGAYTFSAGDMHTYINESGNVIFDLDVNIEGPSGARQVQPAIIHYAKLGTLYAQPGLAVNWLQDVQVILEDTPEPPNRIYPMRIAFFPLINWIWAGGLLMVIGGTLGLLRPRKRKTAGK